MKQAYLLTGKPGVGKTTLIREAIAGTKRKAGGFYTREIRGRKGRQGFEIVTLAGTTAVLSHVDFHSPHRVSKYGVNVDNLDNVGVAAVRRAVEDCEVVVIDEIGKMELFSLPFRESVLKAINSSKKVLGTIMLQPHPWADRIKEDPRVKVLTVTRADSRRLLEELRAWLGD